MHVLVTGGAGFIGSNLCRILVGERYISSLTVLDDLSTGREQNLANLDLDLIKGSILDKDVLKAVCKGKDAVVHLAARSSVPRSLDDPIMSHEINVNGTLSVLEEVRRNQSHLIFASSSSVYGANPVMPKSENLLLIVFHLMLLDSPMVMLKGYRYQNVDIVSRMIQSHLPLVSLKKRYLVLHLTCHHTLQRYRGQFSLFLMKNLQGHCPYQRILSSIPYSNLL